MQKKIFLVVALLCHLLSNGFAQNQYPSAEVQLSDMLSQLNLSPITSGTGILADKMPKYADLSFFQGKYLSDSTRLNFEAYQLFYGQLRQAYVTQTALPAVDSLVRLIKGVKKSPVVHLSLAAMKYQRLKPYALSNGLITYDGQRFQDVVNPSESPYKMDTMFIATTSKLSHDTTTVPFVLKDLFTFTNLNITSIQIDFGNGSGYQSINLNQIKYITYQDTGVYNINVKITLTTNEILLSGTQLKIKEPSVNNIRSEKIIGSRMTGTFNSSPDGSQLIGSPAGVEVFYWYNMNECMDNKIRKPLIIIEGFDPLNKYSSSGVINSNNSGLMDQFYGLIGNNNEPKRLKDLINEENYDLFYINYLDSKISIIDNAAFVKQAIEWINAQKKLNGSSEKNIVIGASMGGLVGKWALREFELLGQDHETELYMTFDSPMRGANVPLAVQALPIALGKRKILGLIELQDINGDLESGLSTITSKAARQMIYYYLGDCKDGCTTAQLSVEHDEFYDALDARGELVVPYVALSNGALDGTGMMFGAGAKLVHSDQVPWYLNAVLFGPFIDFDIEVKGWALPGIFENSSSNLIAEHTIEFPEILSVPLLSWTEKITISNTGFITYDNAPGGLRPFAEIEKGQILDKVGWIYKTFCFIPTISSLDLRGVTNPFTTALTDITTTTSSFAPQVRAYQGSTTNSLQYEEFQKNQEHVTLNNNLATFLLGNIKKYELNADLSNRTYNYGSTSYINSYPNGTILSTSHIIKKNLTISNTGKLWINRDAKIDYTDVATNPPNNSPKFFDVLLGADFCSAAPSTVTVINGGEITIGHQAVKNRGSLIIPENTRLVIANGGLVIVDDLSNIIVKQGGTIEIQSGGKLKVLSDGRLTIEKGASLIVHDGADIELEKAMSHPTNVTSAIGSVIDLNGQLFLPDGRILLKGSGFLIFGKDHSIKSGAGFVKLESLDDDHVAYRVDKEINMNLYDLSIINAKFYLNDHIKFFTKSFLISGSTLQSVVGQVTAITTTYTNIVVPSGGGNFIASNIVTSRIENSVLDDVSIIVDGVSGGGKPTLFLDYVTSVTKRRANNFELSNIPVVSLSDCNISTQAPNFIPFGTVLNLGKVGLQLENVGSCKVANSIIEKFILANGVVDKFPDKIPFAGINCINSYNVYLIENTLIDNCYHGVVSKVGINVLMDKATISNCDFGIKMFGDASTGLVKMLCSALLENKIGIYGYDVTLAIDGIINQQNTTFIPQNRFEVSIGNNIHFSISYSKKNVTNIFARKNYWINPQKYSLKKSISGQNIPLDQSMPGDGVCGGKNFTHCTASPPIFPITQSGIPADVYAGFCANSYTCSGFPIMQNYWKGYNCLYNGEYESAIAYFIPLAEQSYESSGYSEYCQDMMNEARAWVGGYQSYQGQYELLKFDSLACLLKWGTPYTPVLYELQKKNGSTWTTVPSAVNPYPIDGYNFGDYRLKITKNNCPVFISEEVHAECDTICIDLLSANWYLDTLISLQTQLSQATNYSIKIDLRHYDPADPVVHTMTFPIVGNTSGVNINIIDPFNQYPLNFGYHALWTIYIECNDCNEDCTNDTAIIMLPPVRLNNYIQNKQALLSSSKESQLLSAKIYPNPSSDNVIIESDNGSYDIEISDINGKLLKVIPFDGSKLIIDNTDLNSGVYLLKIRGKENKLLLYQSKIVKIE